MYQALYRKYRPQTFSDVVGQKHITETLRRQIENGRLSHAYLFVGTRGTGKTTCAKILAKAANCEHPVDGNPCNECESCRGINSGAILDIEELDAASNNSVDNIRALRDEAIYSPASVRKRVYIIDEVHMLSTAAFNALLKILEEPPEHLIFILATTELHKVPATILSRCQRFSFKRITSGEIADRMKYVAKCEGLDLKDDGAELLSVLAEGSLRDGLSLLDQCSSTEAIDRSRVLSVIGLAGAYETAALAELLLKGDTAGALKTLNRLYSDGKELSAVLGELMTLFRDALIYKVTGGKNAELFTGRNDTETVKKIASSADTKRLIRGTSVIDGAISRLSKSTDIKTETELCLITLSDESLIPGLEGIEARVSRLEQGCVPAKTAEPVAPTERKMPEQKKPEAKNTDMESAPFDTDGATVIEKKAEKPAVESEKKLAPQPEKSTAPEPKAASDGDGGAWKAIVGAVTGKVSRPVQTFLSSEMHSVGIISERELYVHVKSAIAKNMLDTVEVKGVLKEAAEKILGRPVAVNVGTEAKTANTVSKSSDANKEIPDKLSALSRFGNIKFE